MTDDLLHVDSGALRSLDFPRLVGLLDALYGELDHLGKLKMEAIDALAAAQMAQVSAQEPEARIGVIRARAVRDKLDIALSGRRQQVRIVQTLLRAAPADV